MHRLTLPHAFRTSCSNEIKRPFCTPRRGTLLTQRYVRAVEGEKERERAAMEWRNGVWNGGTEEETETRGLHRETIKQARDGARRKYRKRKGETFTHTRVQGVHRGRGITSTKRNAWDKQKCVQQRGCRNHYVFSFLTL